jgi:adenylate kinase
MRKIYTINGLPGSGKGTQAEKFAIDRNLVHISSGQLIRDVMKSARNDAEANAIRERYTKGLIQPDRVVYSLIENVIRSLPKDQGVIFDSFPMNDNQADFLDNLAKNYGFHSPIFILLKADPDEVLSRISKRFICEKCGIPVAGGISGGKCFQCGGKLVVRSDDVPETVKKRIEQYIPSLKTLNDYYGSRNQLIEINGSQSIDMVYQEIANKLNGK